MRALLAAAVVSLALLGAAASALAAPDPLRSRQYGLDIVESDQAHRITRGTGAVVAVIDTGVRASHEDLRGQLLLLPDSDFVDGDGNPQDGDGHGTHVVGTAVASAGNGVGVSSVAPGATGMVIRALDDEGAGDIDDFPKAIDFAVARGANVINLSFGDPLPLGGALFQDPAFNAALDRARARGVVVVAAAGNSSVPVCEQAGDRALCVGSVDDNELRSSFSSFAGFDGVMAPGGSGTIGPDILSTWNNGRYEEVAGTSQAAPHVAGVAALLVERGLRGQAVVNRIRATASDAGLPGRDDEYGAGIVNARAAVTGLPGPPRNVPPASIAVPDPQRMAYVLSRGVRLRCRAAGSGRCNVTVRRGSSILAYGSARASSGNSVLVRAVLTSSGRRRLESTRQDLGVLVQVALPGSATKSRRILLER